MSDDSAPEPIIRRSLYDEMVERLRALIVSGELKPGEKIPELALSARFGVSRTPLREGLKVLAAEGLVSLLPNRGAIVAVITEDEIDELFPIIGALEALAGEMASARASEADLARFEALHGAMQAQFAAGDENAYRTSNRQFHELLFEIAANASLTDLYHSLTVRIHAARFIVSKEREDWSSAMDDHDAILAALKARDGARVGAVLKRHLSVTAVRSLHHALKRSVV